jgi:pimeloyl-ACP methyl ester carboxylesterase
MESLSNKGHSPKMAENIAIVLVPGLGTSPRTYYNIIPELRRRGTFTIGNQRDDSSIEAMAKRILADAPKKFALIGHSMGGYIAFEILRQAPERVLKLALMNTSARPDTDEAKIKRKSQIEMAKQGNFAKIIAASLPAFVHTSHVQDKKLQETITAAHNDAGVEAYIRQQTAIMARKDSRPDLKNIKIPTLVLTGDDDKLIPLEPSQEIVDGIKGAKLVIITQAGHMAPLERPYEVSQTLAEWLDKQ